MLRMKYKIYVIERGRIMFEEVFEFSQKRKLNTSDVVNL